MLAGFVLLLRPLSRFASSLSLGMQNRDQEELQNKAHTHSESWKSWSERFKEDRAKTKFKYLTSLQVSSPEGNMRVCSFAWLYNCYKESLVLELGE